MVYKEITVSIREDMEDIYKTVVNHIHGARTNVVKTINAEQIVAYWHIGKAIVKKEQKGYNRADYGKKLVKALSEKLNGDFGNGFSKTNLCYMRQFYLTYPNRIVHEPRGQFHNVAFNENLSWAHYRILMRESRDNVRNFYEIEAIKNCWSTSQLERQMSSFLLPKVEELKRQYQAAKELFEKKF